MSLRRRNSAPASAIACCAPLVTSTWFSVVGRPRALEVARDRAAQRGQAERAVAVLARGLADRGAPTRRRSPRRGRAAAAGTRTSGRSCPDARRGRRGSCRASAARPGPAAPTRRSCPRPARAARTCRCPAGSRGTRPCAACAYACTTVVRLTARCCASTRSGGSRRPPRSRRARCRRAAASARRR